MRGYVDYFVQQHIVHNQDPNNILELSILPYKKYNHVTILSLLFQLQVETNQLYKSPF